MATVFADDLFQAVVGGIDWVELSRIFPSAVLAILFAIYALRLLKIFQDSQRERDQVWIAQIETQRQTHERITAERDQKWQEAFADGRQRQGESLALIANNMKELTELIRSLHTVFTTHDSYERETWLKVSRELERLIAASARTRSKRRRP